jgi:hypothetical protein
MDGMLFTIDNARKAVVIAAQHEGLCTYGI